MVNAEILDGLVTEIERVHDEQRIVRDTLKEIAARCKAAGFAPAFVRQMAKERAMEAEDRDAKYRTENEYRRVLGLLGQLADTPLGAAAMKGAEVVQLREREGVPNSELDRPKPFAEQTVHRGRGRSRKPVLFDQDHPQGIA